MYLKKICFLSLVVLSAFLTVNGQTEVHVGVTTGYNATFIADNGITNAPRFKSTMTFQWSPVGINAGVDFGRKFGLTLAGIISNQGHTFDIIDIADKTVGRRLIEMQYIQ